MNLLKEASVEVIWHEDMWQVIKDCAISTMGKRRGSYPTEEWKMKILMAEHSPIREGHIIVRVNNIPAFVHGHLVRHHNGIEKYISTLRVDRADYKETPTRNSLQSGVYDINLQGLISISRRRLCHCASAETQAVWCMILEAIRPYEPEAVSRCVKECVYRGGICPEMKSCGYNKSPAFVSEMREYIKGFEKQINFIKD